MYKIVYAKTALKDIPKLKSAHLDEKAKALISVIKENPFQNPPPYEKLVGDLNGSYSRRINVQHRLVYDVFEEEQTIKILSLWTHYERCPENGLFCSSFFFFQIFLKKGERISRGVYLRK